MNQFSVIAFDDCYKCQHKRDVPGNAHIRCVSPDPDMVGHKHGIKNGWFHYPGLFDPVWKERICNNYERNLKKSRSEEAHMQLDLFHEPFDIEKLWRVCWPQWVGPMKGGYCEVREIVAPRLDGTMVYCIGTSCRLIEEQPDGSWRAVIEMPEPWSKNGTELILEKKNIWAPVSLLRRRYVLDPETGKPIKPQRGKLPVALVGPDAVAEEPFQGPPVDGDLGVPVIDHEGIGRECEFVHPDLVVRAEKGVTQVRANHECHVAAGHETVESVHQGELMIALKRRENHRHHPPPGLTDLPIEDVPHVLRESLESLLDPGILLPAIRFDHRLQDRGGIGEITVGNHSGHLAVEGFQYERVFVVDGRVVHCLYGNGSSGAGQAAFHKHLIRTPMGTTVFVIPHGVHSPLRVIRKTQSLSEIGQRSLC